MKAAERCLGIHGRLLQWRPSETRGAFFFVAPSFTDFVRRDARPLLPTESRPTTEASRARGRWRTKPRINALAALGIYPNRREALMSTAAASTSPSRRRVGRVPTEHDLWTVATDLPDNKNDVSSGLRELGCRANPEYVAQVLEYAARVRQLRANREERRIKARVGAVVLKRTSFSTPPVRLPAGTPASRLRAARVSAVAQAARAVIAHGAAGGHSMRVGFVVTHRRSATASTFRPTGPPIVDVTKAGARERTTTSSTFRTTGACGSSAKVSRARAAC